MTAIIREVTIGDCRLIQGDCLEVMKELGEVDMVCTSPPAPKPEQTGFGYEGSSENC